MRVEAMTDTLGSSSPPEPWRRPEAWVHSCGMTDIGCRRERNEDCFGFDDSRKVYVVADGIGGGSHGDVAARIAVDGVHEHVARVSREPSLEQAIHNAQTQIWQAVEDDKALQGMGTTVVAMLFEGPERARVAHVGDSRAYCLRDGQLQLLTRDHTVAGEFVEGGRLTPEEAEDHPLNHVLTRALSVQPDLRVETRQVDVRGGDIFLLCSDGLTKMVAHSEIQSCLETGGGPEAICYRLIRQAVKEGGFDNITALVVEVRGLQEPIVD